VIQLEAGGGDEERLSFLGRKVGTIREWLENSLTAYEDLPLYKKLMDFTRDELAASLRTGLQALFKEARADRSLRGEDAAEAILKGVRDVAFCFVGMELERAELDRVRGTVTALLAKQTSPAQAAIDATVTLLGSTYEIARDAAVEGAKDRIRAARADIPPDFLPIGPLVVKPKP
jgi:hypothetical protein